MKKAAVLIISLLIFNKGYSQEYSNNSLFASVGIGISENLETEGVAINFGLGYQKDIWKNRLRLVPSLVFGNYKNLGLDVPDSYFQSTSLRMNLNFDIIKVKSFSTFIGTGITGNYSSGLEGTGGDPGRSSSHYFKEFHFAYNGMLGFRINPLEKRIGYELKLFDFSINFWEGLDFAEIAVFQFRLLIKLNKP